MPKLIVTKGTLEGKVFIFGGDVVFAGRASENDIQLEGREISRKHFKFVTKNDCIFIEDLKSRNGTLLNGEVIAPGKEYAVNENDILCIGNSEFQLIGLPNTKGSQDKIPSVQPPETDSNEKEKPFKERRSREQKNIALIWEVTELLRQSISIDEVLEKVLKHLMTSLPRIDTAVILLYDQQKEEFVGNFSTERFENVMEDVPYSRTIVDRVVKSGKAIRMSNTKYEASKDISDSINDLKIKSILCVPLISNEETLGVIYVDSRGVYGFRKDDLLLLNSLSGPIAVAVEKALLTSELEAMPFVVD